MVYTDAHPHSSTFWPARVGDPSPACLPDASYTCITVEAAAWLEGGSRVCDQCPGGDPFSLWADSIFLLFVYTSTARPYLLQQANNQLVHNFFSQQNTSLFLSFWTGFICGWPRPVSSRSAKQLLVWLKVTPYYNHCKHYTCQPGPPADRLFKLSKTDAVKAHMHVQHNLSTP
jgi:hypothetical protein